MNLAQVVRIARREYLARVRSRAFRLATVLVPLLLGSYLLVVPALNRSSRTELRLAVVDAGTGFGQALADQLREIQRPRITVAEVAAAGDAGEAGRQRFTAAVQDRALDGYLLLEPDADATGGVRARYFAREAGDPRLRGDLAAAVRAAAVGEVLAGTGVDLGRVRAAQSITLGSVTISREGENREGFQAAFVSTLAMAMLLYMAVLINGQGMATAIVEEKSSRLIEVILGAVTANEFMAGKILGVLGSGLTQLAVWMAVAAAFLLQALPGMNAAAAAAGVDFSTIVNARLLAYFAIFFALGYLLYSVMFAALAATCTSTLELGQSMFIAVLPMVVGLMAAISVFANPSTTLTRVLSLIPFFTPLVMLARVNILMPPLWEVWLGIALLAATSALAAWLSAKIFRYALLMTGQRPTLPDLLRVVRAG
jgi:ABC-2 type transport system permease protein